MKSIHVTMSDASLETMRAAAEYAELPLSLWARGALLDAARSSAHRIICASPKSKDVEYKWAGKPCTKEEFEEWSKLSALNIEQARKDEALVARLRAKK